MRGSFPRASQSWLISVLSLLCVALLAQSAAANEKWRYAGTGSAWRVSDSGGKVAVVNHKSIIIEFDEPYNKARIADEKIADVLPLTDRSVYVVGKGVGSTSLALLDDQKRVIAALEVDVTHDMKDLRRKIRDSIPFANVKVSEANGRILLSGTVADASSVQKAIAIAEQYAPKAVTNTIEVRSVQQVMLEVRFIEANRTASRELGIGSRLRSNRFNADIGGQAVVGTPLIGAEALLSGSAPFGTMIARLLDKGLKADAIVRALEQRGLARRLAEPNLVTMSGDKASFLAGGEFPFPVDSGDNTITIAFKKFGVALDFTPTVLSDGLINLKIEPEVSELDAAGGIRINGTQIPGLVVRKAQTTVELRNGQSFAIAGLLQHNNTRLSSQVPWLGSVPVLGPLFRSAQYQKNQTDLVIIVTPRLVRGAGPGEKLASPFDHSKPSNDLDYFALSRDEVPNWKATVRAEARGTVRPGHIITLRERRVMQ
jgi:pilus assembly protein CpaC